MNSLSPTIPAYRAISNARIEQVAQAEERRVTRSWHPADTSDPRQWARFKVMLRLRRMRAGRRGRLAYRVGRAVVL